MIYNTSNIDTVQAVKDTLAGTTGTNGLQDLSFDLANIQSIDLVISILGYSIVFASLVFLSITFISLTKALNYNTKRKLKGTGQLDETEELSSISGETTAAISMALSLHFREIHDFENTIITIKKVQKPYSPWSSKIYGLRQYPKK